MPTVAKLKDGDLLLAGHIDERTPAVTDRVKARYIRDWNSGSNISSSQLWVEIQAIDKDGVNVALNKPVFPYIDPPYLTGSPSLVTNGDTNTSSYFNAKGSFSDGYVIVDLEDKYYLNEVKVWHYFADARTFYKTKTEISADGNEWFTIFDSTISGEYLETSAGKTHTIPNGSLIAHYPFDYTLDGIAIGNLYEDKKIWHTEDFVDAKTYPLRESGNYTTLVMEADIYLESTPVERYTVLQSHNQYGAMYLSIDSNLNVSAYNHAKVSNGYHSSTAKLQLNTWHRITHINTLTETIIMIDGVIDKVIPNLYDPGVVSLTINSILIGSENISRHFQGYIKDIKFGTVNPLGSVGTNTIYTADGIRVEEGTTNIITNPTGPTSWGSSKDPVYGFISDRYVNTEFGLTGYEKTINSSDYRGTLVTIPWSTPVDMAVPYTFSIYARCLKNISGAGVNLNYQGADATAVRKDITKYHTFTDNNWKKIDLADIPSNSSFASIVGYMKVYLQSSNGQETIIQIVMPQMEQKSFSTSFITESRSASTLYLKNVVPITGDYTINFKYKLNTSIGNNQGYNSIMSMGTYNSNNSWTIMDSGGTVVNGNIGFIRKGNAGEWGWSTTSLTPSSEFGKENTITIVKDSTNYRCYNNGVLKGTIAHLSTDMQDYLWIGSRQNGDYMDSTTFRDLSVYNRALSEKEIKALTATKMSLNSEGDIISEITEKPNSIPLESVYIPLGNSGNSYINTIVPTEDKLRYENGTAWVGAATTNYYPDVDGLGVVDSGGTLTQILMTDTFGTSKISKITKIEGVPAAHASFRTCIDPSRGVVATMSFKVKLLSGSWSSIGKHWAGGTSSGIDREYIGDGWYQCWHTATTPSTGGICSGLGFVGTDAVVVLVTEPQLELEGYRTPYVPTGTAPYGHLNYISTDLSPNGYKDFTFSIWAKYMKQSGWQLSGDWGTWYFGISGNALLQFSWVDVTQKTVNTPVSVPKGKWVQIGVSVKENQFIDIYLNGKRELNWTGLFTLSTVPSDFALNSIDVTSQSYPLNAFVKDMILAPKAFTPDEMMNIYKTQMRNKKGLQIQGTVKEDWI